MSTGFSDEDLVDELNSLRTNPRRYANKVLAYKKYFKGDVLHIPGQKAGIKTEEGASAYTEAGEFLEKQSRIPGLEASKGLCKIAQELMKQIQKRDPSELNTIDMEGIIGKYGKYRGEFSRSVDFGGETPEQVLVNLIVGDGDSSRAQRQSLLCTDFKKVGVANGIHPTYGRCSVIVTCNAFENSRDKDDTENFGGNDNRYEANVKTKKVVMSKGNNNRKDNYEEELPEGCVSISKSERITVDGGKKVKIIKITKIMEDGSKEIETIKESVEEE